VYYRSGTGGGCCIGDGKTKRNTHQMAALFLPEMTLSRHLEITTSNWKSDSVNRCVFTGGTILSNFSPIRFQTTEPIFFLKRSPHKKNNKMSSDMRSVPGALQTNRSMNMFYIMESCAHYSSANDQAAPSPRKFVVSARKVSSH